MSENAITLGFGGGCHWCTEAVFQRLRGVNDVKQGFILSDPPDDSWSEAVEVTFDPQEIPLEALVSIHLATHASQADHKMRGKYRSAIYSSDAELRRDIESKIYELSRRTGGTFVTRALMLRGFKRSDERFHDYYRTNPDRPFCQTYIDPKLAKLRAGFAQYLETADTRTDA